MLTGHSTYGLGQVDILSGVDFVSGFFQFYWPYLLGGGLLLILLMNKK